MNRYLLFIAVTIFSGFATAQDIRYGALGGLNINIVSQNITPNQPGIEEENSSGFGFHLGGFGTYGLSEDLQLRAELQLAFRPISNKVDEEISFLGVTTKQEGKVRNRDSFLLIPLMANYRLNDNIDLHGGFSLGFLLGSKQSGEVTTTTDGESETFEVDGNSTAGRNGFELGFMLGGEYRLNEEFSAGLRYMRGLTDLNENNSQGGVTFKSKYNVIALYVTYLLGER